MFKMKQRNTFSLNEKQNEHKPTKLSITNYHSRGIILNTQQNNKYERKCTVFTYRMDS